MTEIKYQFEITIAMCIWIMVLQLQDTLIKWVIFKKKVGIVVGNPKTVTHPVSLQIFNNHYFVFNARVYAENKNGISEDFAELSEGVKVSKKPKVYNNNI